MTARPLRILALDASLAACSVALLEGEVLVAEQIAHGDRGQAQRLAPMLRDVLQAQPGALDAVAATIGPGSFTGIRAGLALAHGLATASGIPLVGVGVAEALAASLPPLPGRALWVVIDSRRGRIFLDRGAGSVAVALDDLPRPDGPVAVAGDAAEEVAARLAAAGADCLLTGARQPLARHVAEAARRRLASGRGGGTALPLYVDPPEARLPGGGMRPAPRDAA